MKVITDYFTSPRTKSLPQKYHSPRSRSKNDIQSDDGDKDDNDDHYELRKIRIRLADPAVPDSYVCEVYDTSFEDSLDEDVPLCKIAKTLKSGEVEDKKPELVTIEGVAHNNLGSPGRILAERNTKAEMSDHEPAGRRLSTRVKKSVLSSTAEEVVQKRGKTPIGNNQDKKGSITKYFKRSAAEEEKKIKKGVRRQKENDSECVIIKEIVPLAPLFLPPQKKPKIDPEVEKCRKAFLHSGIPDAIKKVSSKQIAIPEEPFPTVVHVQQRCGSTLWMKRPVSLQLRDEVCFESITPLSFRWSCMKHPAYFVPKSSSIKIDKHVLEKLKVAYRKVPIEKMHDEVKQMHRRGKDTGIKKDDLVWAEKYRPTLDGVIGNDKTVILLKEWLVEWKEQGGRCNSEAYSSDEDEAGVQRLCLLEGPVACGKTSLVYAVASALDLNVIEINASSKRSGKKLIAEIQEATRSHEVREGTGSAVILVEDADIVFEEDEGFIPALQGLISSAKRPVLLLSSDSTVRHLDRFRGAYTLQLQMSRPHFSPACAFLELICHMEGVCPPRSSLLQLLSSNHLDLRRSLLELQLWKGNAGWEVAAINNMSSAALWWASHERLFGETIWHEEQTKKSEDLKHKAISNSRDILKFFECLSISDVVCVSKGTPCELTWNKTDVTDSLSLLEDYSVINCQVAELSSSISSTIHRLASSSVKLDSGQPPSERRWREARVRASADMESCIPHGAGRSSQLDYLPNLRRILRAEVEGGNTSRRRSRGCHYLRALGIEPSAGNILILSNVFNSTQKENIYKEECMSGLNH